MAEPAQIPLLLVHRPALGQADFLVSASNEEAVRLISAWRDWPGQRLALVGPARAGKTHLAHVWMHEAGARRLAAPALAAGVPDGLAPGWRLVIDDAEALGGLAAPVRDAAEEALFHLLNRVAAGEGWVLLTGREPPRRWAVRLPDLASRLAALPVARIAPPDDALLGALMVKLFADRQLRVAPEVIGFLIPRIERSFAAVEAAVSALDARSLATRRRVTRALAAEYLAQVAGAADGEARGSENGRREGG